MSQDNEPTTSTNDSNASATETTENAHGDGAIDDRAIDQADPADPAKPGERPVPDEDLVLPAIAGGASGMPERLIVFLHGAGSTPQSIISLALAWQIKFQSALVALPQGPHANANGGFSWIDPHCAPATVDDVDTAVDNLLPRLDALGNRLGIPAERTVIVGLTQGAWLALELAFRHPARCGVVVTYGSRLYRVPQDGDSVGPAVRMVHGELDSVVTADYARAALRRLTAVGADVTLELLSGEGHAIAQPMINAGTQMLMDTLFGERLRTREHGGRLH